MSVKLHKMLQEWPSGGVVSSQWLEKLNISKQLRRHYISSKWIESFGRGAFKRVGDRVTWEGALSSIQHQLNIAVHIAGKTALEIQGYAHFVSLKDSRITLFSPTSVNLPKWFNKNKLGIKVESHQASFLKTEVGISTKSINGFALKISSPERAIFEVLYLVPHHQSLEESKHLMGNLATLRPKIVQQLLDACGSIKVKRLFLLLAEHEQLPCLKHLNLDALALGSGNRTLIKGGYLHPKYKITIPKTLLTNET